MKGTGLAPLESRDAHYFRKEPQDEVALRLLFLEY